VVDLCIHVANIIYLVSFLTRDMMWLRILTCCGLVLGVVFFTCQPAPMYGPTVWHLAFLLINGVQIRRLVLERRRLNLSKERERLAQEAFKDLSRDEMLNLLTRAMCAQAERLPDLRQAARQPLSEDEQVVRDIAFRGLSKKELVNLLTRRLWVSLRWMNPGNWRIRRAAPGTAGPFPEPGRGSVGHSRFEARNVEPPPHPGSAIPASGREAGGEGWAAPVGDRT
jgi:hypothetical protein